MAVYENFHSYRSGIYDTPEGRKLGCHAMCIIGYDDNLNAFRIVNSWGEKGFLWMSYDIFEKLCASGCAVMIDVIDTIPDIVPDPAGFIGTKGVYTDHIELTWNETEDANFYLVYRVNNEDGVLKEIARTTENSYSDESLPPGVTYIYAVKSGRSKNLISNFSEITEGWTGEEKSVPGIPTGLVYTFYNKNPLLMGTCRKHTGLQCLPLECR